MRTKWLGLALLLLGNHAWAQVGELYNADVTENTSITDPASAINAAEGQWLAFSMPVLDGTRSPCCWKGNGTEWVKLDVAWKAGTKVMGQDLILHMLIA